MAVARLDVGSEWGGYYTWKWRYSNSAKNCNRRLSKFTTDVGALKADKFSIQTLLLCLLIAGSVLTYAMAHNHRLCNYWYLSLLSSGPGVFFFGYWYNSWPFPSCMYIKATCAYNLPILISSLTPDVTHHSALTYSGFILSGFDLPPFSLSFFYLVFIFYVLT